MNYLFDTHALITLFHQEPGYQVVQSLFEGIESDQLKGFISSISLTELRYLYKNRFGEKEADARLLPVLKSGVEIIPVHTKIALIAGSIKKPGISVADAIIAATALEISAKVVTGDRHFSYLGVEILSY